MTSQISCKLIEIILMHRTKLFKIYLHICLLWYEYYENSLLLISLNVY